MKYAMGLDIGSTTVKAIVLDQNGQTAFQSYERHFSDIRASAGRVMRAAYARLGDARIALSVTGSGGLGFSEALGVPFVQEVIAVAKAVERSIPTTDVAIELGGEDAKITYFGQGLEQRMNGACAGGTGVFIDQMALLLQTDAAGLDRLAGESTAIYPIASRCGVFAKTDLQLRTSRPRSFRRWSIRPSAASPAASPYAGTWCSWADRCAFCPNCASASSKRWRLMRLRPSSPITRTSTPRWARPPSPKAKARPKSCPLRNGWNACAIWTPKTQAGRRCLRCSRTGKPCARSATATQARR